MLTLAVGALAVALGFRLDGPTVIHGSPLVGKSAPAIRLTDLEGRTVDLADYRGRPVIINFWASWCEPCKKEFPLFVAVRAAHVADGLEILGIVHDDSADLARAFASAQGAPWPMLMDPDDVAWNAYAGIGLPTTFYVDRAGVVRVVSFGPPASGSIEELIARIL
ncbi:MAG: TlpA disulfide reductase family protein [Candidatus Limnocylindrales bacterium]